MFLMLFEVHLHKCRSEVTGCPYNMLLFIRYVEVRLGNLNFLGYLQVTRSS
jgi:hypothetical protein